MNLLQFVTHSVLDIFFPNNCELCQKHLTHKESFICLECKFNLPYIDRHQLMLESIQKIFWGRIEIEKVYSVYNYQKGNQTQRILHEIKYKNKTKLAIHLGEIIGSLIPKNHTFDLIIPIPLHPKKLKKRGYNQSQLLAEGVQQTNAIPIDNNSVVRTGINQSQTQFSKYDRWDNVKGIFKLKDNNNLAGKHILIVDDVLTTGATIEACAAAILSKVDCKISVATLATRV
ncbi:MAG: ComF family protein [Crocinitomicaceae bacterium]